VYLVMAIGVLQRWMNGCLRQCSAHIVVRNKRTIQN